MKFMMGVFILLSVSLAENVFAGVNSGSGGSGIMVWFFIGFIALFVVSQLIPSVILTVSLLRGLFAKKKTDAHEGID